MLTYYSTSSLSKNFSFPEILRIYNKLGIKNVELGVCFDSTLNAQELIKRYDFNYIVHHLFPPPKIPFIVNLASENNAILKRSLVQMENSIDFCQENNISLLSFHSGFRSDPDSHFKFNFKKISDYEISFNIFVDSLKEIVDFAEERDVNVAIENNVLVEQNVNNGRNDILLMCELWEYQKLFKNSNLRKIGLLIDLGHLKITANSLNFDADEFIYSLKDKVYALHIHENNGTLDEHKCIKEGDWALTILNKYFKNEKIPIINECKFQNEYQFEKFHSFFSNL